MIGGKDPEFPGPRFEDAGIGVLLLLGGMRSFLTFRLLPVGENISSPGIALGCAVGSKGTAG